MKSDDQVYSEHIYDLVELGRNFTNHKIEGNTREEIRASLREIFDRLKPTKNEHDE